MNKIINRVSSIFRFDQKTYDVDHGNVSKWVRTYYDEKFNNIAEVVITGICKQINLPLSQLTPETDFVKDLGSCGNFYPIRLITAIEETFDLHLNVEDDRKIRTINDLILVINQKINGNHN